jgi:hypothetical protein
MTLQLLHSEFPYLWGNLIFFFISASSFLSLLGLSFLSSCFISFLLAFFPCFSPSQSRLVNIVMDPLSQLRPNGHLMLKYIFIYPTLGHPHYTFSIYIHVQYTVYCIWTAGKNDCISTQNTKTESANIYHL